ncbi:Ig-like domain-containing protein [Massilia solisilvae]|uniref:Ig-like domain-containing protein n=1 Tax=Massilia solisilvae TaxID=1811225 RepID=A0ABT2BLA5_9BURK|nr:Ig-like domain-containing protein [Massilia solisilvae]MCS0609296.1 Ig-like domain-containing protein [Massilia solisilvae]
MNRTLIDAATGTPNAAVEDGAAFASATTSNVARKEVVFIDTAVADYLSLEAAVRPGVEVVRIDGGQDGLAQLATWAQTHSGYDAIHILSHGTAGTLRIGTDEVNTANVASAPVRDQFAALGQALNAGGDLLLYGCDVGAGADGQQLVAAIATATHADVAASTDTTGAASMGGNWSLEFSSGQIDSASVVDVSHQDAYAGVLTLPANGYTTFSNITAPISYGQLASGIPGTLSVSDIAGSGWNLNTYTASSSIVFTVKGVYNNGQAFVRVQGSNISYVDWTLNDSTYTFDLQSFDLAPTSIGCTFTIQAIDSSNNLIAGSAFSISASGTSATAPTFAPAEVPAYLTPLYNDIHGFRITLQDAGSYSPMFDNILINDLKQSNSPPTSVSAPSISGTTTLGSLLGASTGTWSDFDGDTLTYSYQWYRAVDSSGTSAAMITGAANSTYMLDAADAHKYVKVAVTANDGQGHAVTSASGWTAVTDSVPVNTARPTITGTVAVGSAVGAASGSWIDVDGDSLTYSYQWFRADDSSGTNAALITGANTASYTPSLSDKDKYLSVKVTANDGNGSLTQTGSTWSLVTEIPTVTNVTSSDANVAYKAGSTLTITVGMSSAVTVDTSGGTPKLALSSGGTANYSGGSGTSTLSFSYVVGANENSSDLDYSSTAALSLNGATIRNAANVDANTTLAVPGTAGSLGANKAIVIDTTPPAASATAIYFSADSGASANDLVTNVASQTIMGMLSAPLAAGETIMASLNNGATWINANGIVGSTTFMFFGTLFGSDTLKVKLVDAVGNEGSVYSTSYVLDTVAPANTIGAIALSSDTGISSTDFITKSTSPTITATLSAPVAGTDIVYGSVNGGLTWTNITNRVSGTSIIWSGATLGNGTDSIKFKVTDLAGNDGTVSTQSYTLDTVAPTISISTAGFSSDTGVSPVDFVTSSALQTISGTLSANIAAGETVWVSLDNGSTWSAATSAGNVWNLAGVVLAGSGTLKVKVSDVAGNDGPVYAQAYVLDTVAPTVTFSNLQLSADTGSSSTDFITNAAAQTITATLSAALAAGETLYGSIDGGATWTNITAKVSGTTLAWNGVTLAAGSGTLKLFVADSAGNQGAGTARAYTLDTTAPALTFGNVHISADTGVSSSDLITNTASQTITATLSGALAGGDIVYGSTDGGATWTDVTAKVSGTALAWDGALLSGASSIKLKVSDAAGNDGAVASQSYVLDTTAPAKTGASVSFSSDTGTSATDLVTRTAAQTITGTLTAALVSGEAVYVSLDNGATWTTASAVPGQATWSLTGQTLAGSGTIKVKVGDTAGNDGAVFSRAYVLDTTAPAITAGNIALSADTGSSSTDFVTNTAGQTIGATLSAALAAGDVAYGSLDGGATWTDITAKVSGTTLAWNGVTLVGSNTIKLKVSDLAGNDGAVASQAYTLDMIAPALTFGNVHISADTGVMSTDFITNTASQTITATLSGGLAAGDIVYGSTDGGATWTDVTAKVSGTTLTWDGATLTGSSIKLKVSDAAGNDGTVTAQSYVLDTTAPTRTGASVSFSSDTGASATDLVTGAAAQNITGTLSAALASGEAVYVSLDDGATWAMANASAGQATWSLPGQTLSGSSTIKVKVGDTAGNDGPVYSHTYVLDTAAPAITVANIALSADTGSSASDFVTNTASQTISAILSGALGAGEVLYGSLDGGATWTDITAKVAGTTIAWDGVTLAGSNTIKLKVSDLAGNDGAVVSQAWTVDTTAPVVTFSGLRLSADTGGSGADFVTSAASQTISATLSAALAAGDTVYGSLDGGATWTDVTSRVSGTTLAWDGALLAGASTIKLKVSDAAGNDGPVYAQAYVLDTTAPAAAATSAAFSNDTGTSGTDLVTKSAAQTISGTLSASVAAGETVYVSLDAGATWTAASASGSTWSLAGQTLTASGTLKVKVSDIAGNDSAVYSHAYTLDTTAPATTFSNLALSADTGASASDFVTSTAVQTITATLSGSLALGDIVYGSTDNGATWTDVTAKVSGTTLAWDGATLTGDTIKLKVVDAAGNDGAVASHFYVLDSAAPANTGASVSFSSDTGASATDLVTRTAAQTISGTLTAALASAEGLNDAVYVSLDDGVTWTMANALPGQTTWSLPGQTLTGNGVIKVKVSDMAGNDGPVYSQSYVLDAAAPAVAIGGLAPSSDTGISGTDRLTRLATPTFNGTAEAGALVKLFDTDGTTLLGSATADGAGSWTITASAMAGGSHDVSATATDTAGNTGDAPARLHIDIDLTAPTAQAVPVLQAASDSGAVGDGLTNLATPTVAGHGEAFAQVSLYDTDGATLLGSAQADATGAWQITASTLADGSHALSVKETDAAGNVSAASAPLNLVIDTTAPAAPAAPTLTAASDSDTRGDGVTEYLPVFEGSALANARVELFDGATRIGAATADASGKWTIAPVSMQLGTHSVTARQYDAAGNLSGASATFALRVVEKAAQTSLVDGVQVGTTQVTLPGGQAGAAVVIPIVTPTRVESTGSPGVADIPLASNAGGSVLTAQVAPGYGLTATGAPSQPAANASATLIAAIKAATPDHPIDDQGHLTGNGQSFLDKLPAAQPLLVQTVVPVVAGPTAPTGSLNLNGAGSLDQHVALVIDTSRLPSGSTIGLQNVDFAAVIGGANVVSDGRSQLLSGDAASQHFTVATGGSGAIYAGGGNDGFTWGLPPAQNGANVRADVAPVATQTLMHGGAGSDTITFNGNRDSFNIEFHNGYQVVSSKAQPSVKALVVNVETLQFGDSALAIPTGDDLTTIAGLYQGIYGRQADLYGFEFWADAHQQHGMSWGKMAMMMITQGEWNAQHEALNGTTSHDVEVLYEALFSRKADAAGLDFWVGVMKQQGLSLEQVADYMVQAPEMNGHREMVTNWDFLV